MKRIPKSTKTEPRLFLFFFENKLSITHMMYSYIVERITHEYHGHKHDIANQKKIKWNDKILYEIQNRIRLNTPLSQMKDIGRYWEEEAIKLNGKKCFFFLVLLSLLLSMLLLLRQRF